MKLVFGGGALGTTFVVVMLNGCVGSDPDPVSPSSTNDAGSTTTDSSTSTSTSTDKDSGVPDLDPDAAAPALCPLGCLPPAPKDWVGPSAVYDGADTGKPTDCPTPYTVKEVEAHFNMTADPATCDCGTATFQNRKCSATVSSHSDSACKQLGTAEVSATSTGCATTSTGINGYFKVGTPTLAAGTCTFPSPQTTLPPVKFEKVEVACGLPQSAACDTRPDCVASPTPAQPFTRLCIHHDGDVSCPSADYAVKLLTHTKVDDQRTCTACVAGTPTGGACGTAWGISGNTCTSATPVTDKVVGTCYSYPGVGTDVDGRGLAPTAGTCPHTGGTPDKAAASTDPVTFCCNR